MWSVVLRWLGTAPRWLAVLVASMLVSVIGFADYATGAVLSVNLFYIGPVALLAWVLGRGWGALLAIACVTVSLIGDVAAETPQVRSFHLVWNAAVRLGVLLIVNDVLVRLHHSLTEESRLARTDSLTGIANARWFDYLAERELARSRRFGHPLTLVYVDLDDFKRVNDDFGHSVGDRLLQTVAETITANLRSSDVIARLGGDEFAVLLPETSIDAARAMWDRLRILLADLTRTQGWPVTLSIGVAEASDATGTIDDLVAEADRAMYEAKGSGKDRIEVATREP